MTRTLLAAAAAVALLGPAAGAATVHKHRHHVAQPRLMRTAPVGMYGGYTGYGYDRGYGYDGYGYRGYRYGGATWNGTAGPPWSGPNQCWVDLGYGRYESCDQ